MSSAVTLKSIRNKIETAMLKASATGHREASDFFNELLADIDMYSENGIDFKTIVNAIDDSLVIADGEGRYIYTNPSYTRNTGVSRDMIVGKTAAEIESQGKIFTRGAAIEVLETKKKVFRLATVHLSNPPQAGFVAGVPIFDEDGKLENIVVTSRPIFTLKYLQEGYQNFLSAAKSIEQGDGSPVREHTSASELSDTLNLGSIVGNSPSMNQINDTIKRVAPTDATVLITGESGAGKEVAANEIYRNSKRASKPFIKVNCASIPASLLESELFGYVKGAFSGANSGGKIGLFEAANNGTLLLDEIGDMPMDLQVKLLRAIQDREIYRVGGTTPIKLDIRIIASTNSELKKKIEEGTFRRDLYYRLNVVPVNIPPLRERRGDIRPLCSFFEEKFKVHNPLFRLTENQYRQLEEYRWPGNVRELQNVIEYMAICYNDQTPEMNDYTLSGILGFNEMPPESRIGTNLQSTEEESYGYDAIHEVFPFIAPPVRSESRDDASIEAIEAYGERREALAVPAASLKELEKQQLIKVLAESRNLREAGAKLGINASTVSRKIKQYGIEYKK